MPGSSAIIFFIKGRLKGPATRPFFRNVCTEHLCSAAQDWCAGKSQNAAVDGSSHPPTAIFSSLHPRRGIIFIWSILVQPTEENSSAGCLTASAADGSQRRAEIRNTTHLRSSPAFDATAAEIYDQPGFPGNSLQHFPVHHERLFAPSRVYPRCKRRMPLSSNSLRVTSSGFSLYTFCCAIASAQGRTHLPPIMSIAGNNIETFGSRFHGYFHFEERQVGRL